MTITLKTFISGHNADFDFYDIELNINLKISFTPSTPGTLPKRDKEGSILSYQQIGDPPTGAEIEIIDVEFDMSELNKKIKETVKVSDYVDKFPIHFEKFNQYIFTIKSDNNGIIEDSKNELSKKIMSMSMNEHIYNELTYMCDEKFAEITPEYDPNDFID